LRAATWSVMEDRSAFIFSKIRTKHRVAQKEEAAGEFRRLAEWGSSMSSDWIIYKYESRFRAAHNSNSKRRLAV
jgi:hypothetical protein